MSNGSPEKFGAFVERTRREKRWSQNQLGKLIGAGSAYITSVENGEIWPTDYILDQLAALFGVPHEYLIVMLGPKPQSAVEAQPRPKA
ncbi:DNA-binding protein [Mesorhizobium sp. LSJC268A00]|uniref:helix-turn-helix domain-containing protein n=1 Tax=unclassified Mesorhizobium TaxID=325217 RepID=UPI0003CECC11|nr:MULTISPECIES: helix-turn-helix transcriptional regulator [unclassified Mesorhizobium]ESW64682.1 DNA-binding protein [Mesorhizobium sp. LSJC277A00]ESW96906.1 DNA-binding protein [Mesorhizobium sp. LSJC268A00]ESX54140.1 DNA-binding protein [Mesorhizobium sp. LSHC422A00]ESZ11103.1 DNA-binding protein [Mesorhizobium sp. L2C085B000]